MSTQIRAVNRIDLDIAAAQSELGVVAVCVREGRLAAVAFGYERIAAARQAVQKRAASVRSIRQDVPRRPESAECVLDELLDELVDYAAGLSIKFTHWPLDDSHLTTFQRRVIAACRAIPRGQTRSYGELAGAVGSPRAARAVGTVMATNRWPLIIPCHRVLGAGGKLGGYSARQGLAMKQRLLAMEQQ